MNLDTNKDLAERLIQSLKAIDAKEDLELDTKMIMYRFLSEVERLSEEKGLNRKELAKLTGISASYITQLFRGSKIINLETIAKFQKIFDITFEIKANSNHEINGFWAFHNFKPSYENNIININQPTEQHKRYA